jgi:thiamine monophosphate kinase
MYDCDGEIKMWRAVVDRAIADTTDKKLQIRERIEALDWICNGGLDFQLVCDFANVSPNSVRKKWLKRLIRKQK